MRGGFGSGGHRLGSAPGRADHRRHRVRLGGSDQPLRLLASDGSSDQALAERPWQPLSGGWHTLRHTFATILADTPGTNLKTVQELLGHYDIRQTMRYNNTRDSQQVDAVISVVKEMNVKYR